LTKINNLDPNFVNWTPQVPWAQTRGTRNGVIQEYFFVDLNVVWTTVRNGLARLKQRIDDLLNQQRGGPPRVPEPDRAG
jgi:uncharacterized protein with HEPN domain